LGKEDNIEIMFKKKIVSLWRTGEVDPPGLAYSLYLISNLDQG